MFLYPILGNLANYIAAYRNIQVIAAKAETPKDKKDLADKHWRQLEQLQLALNETKVCSFQRFPIKAQCLYNNEARRIWFHRLPRQFLPREHGGFGHKN